MAAVFLSQQNNGPVTTVGERALTAPDLDGEREDWSLEILQAMVSPSTVEDAALACAAAWINFVDATHVSVVVFDATQTCVVADGQRQDGHQSINVGRRQSHFSALLNPDGLFAVNGPCEIQNPDLILSWPEHFSVVLVCVEESAETEEQIDLVEDISRRLLSRWTTPVTSFANPDHMEAMAEFAAGAGHEINNPLGSIIGQTQLLLKREDRAEHRQALETIGAQAWRIRDMIGDTMLFARPPQPEFTSCDLVAITEQIVSDQNKAFSDGSQLIRFSKSEEHVRIFADDTQVSSLIAHLIRNAAEAVQDQDDGEVVVRITQESDVAASLDVTDNGAEIPDEIRRHLFDPFYSGRQAGRGLGFGLCHCWQIVRMHNGVLTHEALKNGNRFIALLPLERDT